jgi:hypothetical protein
MWKWFLAVIEFSGFTTEEVLIGFCNAIWERPVSSHCAHSPMRSLGCQIASDSVMRERQQPTRTGRSLTS